MSVDQDAMLGFPSSATHPSANTRRHSTVVIGVLAYIGVST